METWAIVTLVLGTSAISSLLTFFITKMQVSHSDARLAKQLERAREADYQQRQREIRSEPLFKLRTELANMACKYEKLVDTARKLSNSSDITYEKTEKLLEEAIDEDTIHMASGNLQQILNIQYDTEIITRVNSIRDTYLLLVEYAPDYENLETMGINDFLRTKGLKDFREISGNVKNKILEVQELINKRLEEL